MERCHLHRTELDLDPMRGPICPHCDAETRLFPPHLWARIMRWVRLRLRH